MTDQLLQDGHSRLVVMVRAEIHELVEIAGLLDTALAERDMAEVDWSLQEIRRITGNMEQRTALMLKIEQSGRQDESEAD